MELYQESSGVVLESSSCGFHHPRTAASFLKLVYPAENMRFMGRIDCPSKVHTFVP